MLSYLPPLFNGLSVSLLLACGTLLLGLLLSLLCTAALELRIPVLQTVIRIYLAIFTGTPLLVQIFLIYYGPGQFACVRESWLWHWISSPGVCALLALALNSAAYSTQLFYQTLRAIPTRYWHSCIVLGMSRCQALAVIGPLALRKAIPAYGNEVTLIFKSTSLASTITLMDLMGQAQLLNNQTYDTITVFALTGAIYLLVNGGLSYLMRRVERRLLTFDQN